MSQSKVKALVVVQYVSYVAIYLGLTYVLSLFIGSFAYRLSNFGIICIVATYFFRSSLIPDVKEKILAKITALNEMKIESKKLLKSQYELEEDIKEQEFLSKKLYDKIKVWSEVFDNDCDFQKEEQEKFLNNSIKRVNKQILLKGEERLRIVVLIKALNEAKKELELLFESEEKGRQFTSSIVESMREDLA